VRAEGGVMVASALKRFVASAEAWLKRRRRAREERRRDQSCVCVCVCGQSVGGAERNGGGIHAFSTRERSSGSAWTMRSRAIRASARQLFVIYGGECDNCLLSSLSSQEHGEHTHDEGVKICLGPFTCEISLRSSFRIGYIFGQERR
jgi:hypothetical protein